MENEDNKKDLNEISELILELGDFLKEYELPVPLCQNIASLMERVAVLLFNVCEDNKRLHDQSIQYSKLIDELNYYYSELSEENEVLKKFVEAVKKFPGFQC
jgi:hypothetical protein